MQNPLDTLIEIIVYVECSKEHVVEDLALAKEQDGDQKVFETGLARGKLDTLNKILEIIKGSSNK